MNAQSLAHMTEADHAVRMLAYYDVREVPDTQLMQIFNCGAADLAQVRQTDQYKSMLQVEQGHVTETNAAIDDGWDDVEKRALGGLVDALDSIADPRMLLAMAKTANQASRRSGLLAKRQTKGGAIIDTAALAGETRVVRLKSRFVEMMQSQTGVARMVEREVTITSTTGHSSGLGNNKPDGLGSLDEALKPSEVKHLLRTALEVNPDEVIVSNRFGPEIDLPGADLSFIDFSTFDEEIPPGGLNG